MELYESKVESRESSVRTPGSRIFRPRPSALDPRPLCAFTIVELLVVISILGIMAALTVPVLKNFAKSDATLGASRQLLDGVARARQLAISQRTTVYMVFVPPNFWNAGYGTWPNPWWTIPPPGLTLAQRTTATNLCDKQLTGYTFVSLSSAGDQPGQHVPHYLDQWQTLPDNTFIALAKFANSPYYDYTITDPIDAAKFYNIYGFATNATFPFPTETSVPWIQLPYIAFDYLGQLVSEVDSFGNYRDAYIPIAKGSVLFARDTVTRAFQFNPPDIVETPPGNSTNSYNIVHIDRLTGRAVLEYQKVQ
jgi:prepilin-type N-terminal cleavage/methylation domain-containing protein